MFSQTTDYAIRAAIDIATRQDDRPVLASELAASLDIPQHYLSKILQQLVRAGVLQSTRGRRGGFVLSRPAAKIRLREVVAPFENLRKCEECILGQPICSSAGACPLHDFWKLVRETYLKELDTRTLGDLATHQLKRLRAMDSAVLKQLPHAPGRATLKLPPRPRRVRA
ncbi:MAG: Rrf2 family transcriptional regulator [Planctomycetes bacterium]|jgi:Rrf2 family protein|nr:Rrf2 family transcriptional regulator [Planctomycetota bacterium]MCL4729777.1 Rrf2 family transcriptional regulator [Planctomycetota bacterium]